MLETKQNLILSIVQRIREYFEQAENKCGCMDNEQEKCIEEAGNALRELAKGVTTLDGVVIPPKKVVFISRIFLA